MGGDFAPRRPAGLARSLPAQPPGRKSAVTIEPADPDERELAELPPDADRGDDRVWVTEDYEWIA
ncbi:hypothetical protein GCM10023191_025900 [Actinoallomurus oryzae]|uniref:Uncharacterized protein n=1 Tax=Actinoallomurus oryzae TaxID=502180 RepID=A0ABP8PUN0_9ACTN